MNGNAVQLAYFKINVVPISDHYADLMKTGTISPRLPYI